MELRERIIYLDNSHLHLLSELRRNDAQRFSAFIQVWNAQRCTLALSQTHLSEINRYDDQVKREARYDLIEALMPVHSDIALGDGVPEAFLLLTNREIFHALIKKGVAFVEGGSLDRFVNAFPTQLTSRDDIKLLKTLPTVDTYRNVLDAFYEANKVGASANSRPTQTKYEAHQLSEIPDAKIDSDLVVDLLRQLEEDQTEIKNLDVLRGLLTTEQINEAFTGVRNTIQEFAKRTEEIGSSKALAEFLGTDPTQKANLRKPIDLLIARHAFEFTARQFLNQLCGHQDQSILSSILENLKLEDCPGTWLKYVVQIQMRKATPIDHPSNYYDLEHLSYLPYVDKMFADKRIVTFANQVLNSDQLPPSLDGTKPPVSVPNSIESIESEISALEMRP
jgi:hypothetical protein